eukprot:1188479-Prorocentrum_minimum.AAC.3
MKSTFVSTVICQTSQPYTSAFENHGTNIPANKMRNLFRHENKIAGAVRIERVLVPALGRAGRVNHEKLRERSSLRVSRPST